MVGSLAVVVGAHKLAETDIPVAMVQMGYDPGRLEIEIDRLDQLRMEAEVVGVPGIADTVAAFEELEN